jgi:hypothetical protein
LAQELIWGRLGLVFVYPMRAVLYGMTLRPWGILIELKKLTEQPLQARITALQHYSIMKQHYSCGAVELNGGAPAHQ